MAKITDVARMAGVSPSTVSHVLNGKRPISKATCERVLAAIEMLKYTPNANARALKSNHTGIIGFFAADITELFVTEIIRGVESVIIPAGAHLLLASGAEFKNQIEGALSFLQSRQIDGIIISYGISQGRMESDFPVPDIPIITINRELNYRIPSIMPDNFRGGYEAAQHLAEAGCRNAAIIAGPEDRPASNLRVRGFLEGATATDISIDQDNILHMPFTFAGGSEAMKQLIERRLHFDGLFCANDYIAAGAMTTAGEAGISIPDALKIVGFDDREFSSFWPTPITTFTQPLFEMGKLAAQYLQDYLLLKKPIPNQTVLASTLVVRKSSLG